MKWLNNHSSTTDLSFYFSISPCALPIKSLTSILKSSKISGHLLLRDSKDSLVSSVSPNLKSGHWKAISVTQITKPKPNFRKTRGSLHLLTSSFGNVKATPVPEEESQAHRKLVTKSHREIEEEYNLWRALQIELQYHWVQWEGYIQNSFTWKTILPNNTTKNCNTMKFVKSGTKFSNTNNVSKGILHLASDWILLRDVKGDYVFPFQLALTELHPDVVLFSKSSK